eukprot:m.177086 g.177086  ORF g.177086 m.177086 type:complete len:734 (+) comp53365_c0_seq2:112-2313(+)
MGDRFEGIPLVDQNFADAADEAPQDHGVQLDHFEEEAPDRNKRHFRTPAFPLSAANKSLLLVCIPISNEEAPDLKRTLFSLYAQIEELQDSVDTGVVLVVDGLACASASMLACLSEAFPHRAFWPPPDQPGAWRASGHSTTILQWPDLAPVELNDGLNFARVRMCVVVKNAVRRTHNSLDWFFNGFCQQYQPEYAFTTTSGTTFQEGCLPALTAYLNRNKNCAAVTASQRVQYELEVEHETDLFSRVYRYAQQAESILTTAAFSGAYNILGTVPVIPTSCGMYRPGTINERFATRWYCTEGERVRCVRTGAAVSESLLGEPVARIQHIQNWRPGWTERRMSPMEYYKAMMSRNPLEATQSEATLSMADGSMLAFLLGTRKHTTNWEPRAVCHRDAHTDPAALVAHRRCETNGSLAGLWWLVSRPGLVWKSQRSVFYKAALTLALLLSLLRHTVQAFTPAIAIAACFGSTKALVDGDSDRTARTVTFVFLLVYIAFVMRHARHPFVPWLFHLLSLLTTATMMLTIAALSIRFADVGWNLADNETISWMVVLVVLLFFVPVALAYLQSFTFGCDAFFTVLPLLLPFLVLVPVFIAVLSAYSIARLFDLTGARGSPSVLDSLAEGPRDRRQKLFEGRGDSISAFVVLVNVLLVIFVMEYDALPKAFVVLAVVVGGSALVQMGLSGIYLLWFNLCRFCELLGGLCCRRSGPEAHPDPHTQDVHVQKETAPLLGVSNH